MYDEERSDLTPKILIENLPDFQDAYEVTYYDAAPDKTFDAFSDELFEHSQTQSYNEPYLYGSYEIYQASRES